MEFVEQWLLPHYKRDPKTHYWDARWWEHTEAVGQLEALWRAWEHFRLDGMTGMAVFFRDYMDPTMSVLTNDRGPFWNKKTSALEPFLMRGPPRSQTLNSTE